MMKLLYIEYLKMRKNTTFLIMLGLFVVSLSCFLLLADKVIFNVNITPIYRFPNIWQFLAYFAKFFAYILGIIAISSIANEYTNKTLRQNVIDGMSRANFVTSKLLFFLAISVVSGILLGIFSLITGYNHTAEIKPGMVLEKVYFLPVLMLYIFAYMVLAFNFGLLVKKTAMGVVLLIVYLLIIENILTVDRWLDVPDWMLPGKALGSMIPFPDTPITRNFVKPPETSAITYITGVAHAVILSGISYLLVFKRDI